MNKKNDFALVRKPSSAVEKAAPGAKRVLSGMVTDALALIKRAKPLRIILLDDEPMLLELLEHLILMSCKDATVLKFNDGDKAWQEILRIVPDLLVTDMNRLGLSGYEMLPLLAGKKVRFPILVLSGTADERSITDRFGSEFLRSLNVSFMNKPYDIQLLPKYLETTLKIHQSP
jgi:DNA-binding response OmpR family regulator